MREPVFESIDGVTQGEFGAWVVRRERGGDVARYELLNGRVVMTPPAGHPHGGVGARLTAIVVTYLTTSRGGRAFDSSQGFELPSGDTVEPDLSVVSSARWLAGPPPQDGKFLRVVPDVAFEILSASTRSRDRGERKAIYERNGVREYWLVDTQAGRLTRFLLVEGRWDTGVTFKLDEQASSEVLPGLVIDIAGLLTTDF